MGQLFSNGARAELALTINPSDTNFSVVADGSLFPEAANGDWFNLVLQDDAGIEIIQCYGHAANSNAFTNIVRGANAREFQAGSVVGLRMVAEDMESIHGLLNSKVDSQTVIYEQAGNLSLHPEGVANIPEVVQTLRNNVKGLVSGKVNTETGKGLTSNDFTTAYKNKLDGIAANAEANKPTNLSVGSVTATDLRINSSTGAAAIVPIATTSTAGLMSAADKTVLDTKVLKTDTAQTITGKKSFATDIQINNRLKIGNYSEANATDFVDRYALTFSTDQRVGGAHMDHAAYAIWCTMPGGWGTAQMNWAVSTNHGNFAYTSPAMTLTDGGLFVKGNVFWNATSDVRLKENIKPIEGALEIVRTIGGQTFDWIGNDNSDPYYKPRSDAGVIAQTVLRVYPIAVRKHPDDDHLRVNYQMLIPLSLQATADLAARVEAAEHGLAKALSLIDDLVERVRTLESAA